MNGRPPAPGVLAALAVALAFSAAAAPARAAMFGSSRAGRAVVLWVPEESFSDWTRLDAALSRRDDLKLTVGLSESMLTPECRRVLGPWLAKGRVEAALRLDGDPILPLIAAHADAPRPDDAPARLAEERDLWRVAVGSSPAGFVPGAGAVSPQVIEALRSLGFSWAASGEYAPSTAPWASAGGISLVPLRSARAAGRELSADDLGLAGDSDGAPVVVDEADGLAPPGSLLRLLEGGSSRPRQGWQSVSEAVKEWAGASRPAARVREWPAWTGSLELWTAGERSRLAWRLYGQAAQALDRYQNSGSADLKALESASAELFAAQANRFFRDLPAGELEQSEKAFRSRLVGVYRKLKQTPPDSLFTQAPASAAADERTDVRLSQGADWLAFDNAPGSFGRAPAGFQLEDGGPPGSVFQVERLRVETNDAGLSLVFRMGRLDSAAAAALEPRPGAAPDLGRVILDAYLDLNHVAGAGASALLFDRGTFVMARDAWEFALTVSAWGAYLYKANPLGSPQQIARLGVLADPASREVRVSIPRSLLRGNALRWGYLVTASAADAATAAKPPVKPLKRGDATTVLGLLAPLEQQKALADDKPGSRPRLTALRAK